MTVHEQKKLLRRELIARRSQLDAAERKAADEIIYRKLLSLKKVQNASAVLCYVSAHSEVDTRRFIENCLELKKTVAAPKCLDGQSMVFKVIDSLSDLESGMYGIDEPKAYCRDISRERFCGSVLIVPGLSFDKDGYRLGYGKGYYDRFISRYDGYCIGLCRKDFLTDSVLRDEYDMPVSLVITD